MMLKEVDLAKSIRGVHACIRLIEECIMNKTVRSGSGSGSGSDRLAVTKGVAKRGR